MAENANDWADKAEFMRKSGATCATWRSDGTLTSLTLAPPAQWAPSAPRPPGPARRMADFHARQQEIQAQKRHDIMFASSSMRPKFEAPPPPQSVVPRAVREREAAEQRGKPTKRTKR